MIQLRTFGGVDLRDAAGREIRPLLSQPKRLALLVYLALANATGFRRRDRVVALFWPELDGEHARGSLRQALSFLRRALGKDVILTRGEEEIGVNRDALDFDASVFVDACAAERAAEALAVYRGDFLEGFFVSDAAPEFQSWVDEQRAELRRGANVCSWSLAEAFRAAGDRRSAAAAARQAAGFAPDDEGDVARLVKFLDGLGDRAGAIAAYEEFAARLKREFDADPAPETQSLIRSVRARNVISPGAVAPDLAAPAPATPVARLDEQSKNTSVQPHGQPKRLSLRSTTYLAIGVAIAMVGYLLIARRRAVSSDLSHATVAVLPFDDINGDRTRRYVADGLTDELITDLARDTALSVINTPTMVSYRDSALTPQAVAARLHADVVVSGSLQFLGDAVHQTVQLSAAGQNRTLWARTFDGTRNDLLRIQADVARELTGRIRGTRMPAEEAGSARPGTQSSDAIDLYISGRHWSNKPTRANLLKSIDLFQQALDAEPAFALPYAGIADAYVRLGYGSWLAPSDAFQKAEAAARQALALDSTLAEPHATLGFVNMYYRWDWPGAEREFKRALAINPSYATGHEWYGLFLTAMGRYKEALSHERRAQELDPLSAVIAGTTGWILHYSRRQDDAQRELQIALRMDSSFSLGHFYLGRVYQARGKLDSALSEYAAAGPLRTWVPSIAGEGYVYGLLGRRADAATALARMDSMSRGQYVTAYGVALVYASMGNRDSAFAWLDRGVKERTHWLVWLNRDLRWEPLRSDRRFTALVRQIGLPP